MFTRVKTATGAWDCLMAELVGQAENWFTADSRDGAICGEILNAHVVITDPTYGIITSPGRGLAMRYAIGELLWYLSGSNRTKDIALYAKRWNELSDNGTHANSAYGHRIFHMYGFDQWDHVKELLTKDNTSRRAIIHIKEASPFESKDIPCTIALQYLIRDNRLHATTFMRSNDIWFGFPYDVFSFTAMQIKMAFELGVDIGTYTHIAGSLHLYQRDYEKYKINIAKLEGSGSTEQAQNSRTNV